MHRRCCWPPERPRGRGRKAVFHFVPEGGAAQGQLHLLGDEVLVLDAVDAQAVGHVLEDALGEGVGLLEDHAHLLPQAHHVGAGLVDVLAVQHDAAFHPAAGDQVVHAVETTQEGGFAAAGRADEGRDAAGLEIQADILQGVGSAVIDVDLLRRKCCCHNYSCTGVRGASARLKVKMMAVLPSSAGLSAQMRPPCRSITCLQMARPRPVEFCPRWRST